MKTLLVFLVVVAAAVGLALVLLEDPGYVLLAYGVWSVESNLAVFVALLLLFYLALYVSSRMLRGLGRLPRRVAQWRAERRQRRGRNGLYNGMLALAEGNWAAAERSFIEAVRFSETPMLNYLGAARAAQHQNALERRDRYLSAAHESHQRAELATGLTQAELQIAQQQYEQALATISHVQALAPKNEYVLSLLKDLYIRLQDWWALHKLLPELRRQRFMPDSAFRQLEQRVYRELIGACKVGSTADLAKLRDTWNWVPRAVQEQPELQYTYACQLHRGGADDEAEDVLRRLLKRHWDARYVRLYGELATAEPAAQLKTVEGWLQEHDKNPDLLYTAGRLCLRNRLWGKARLYFESSLGASPRPEVYKALGDLLAEHIEDHAAAVECYQRGLALAVSTPAAPGAPAAPARLPATRPPAGAAPPALSASNK